MFAKGFSREFLRAAGAFVVAGIVAGSSPVFAQSVTLRSYRDATIRGGTYSNRNFGDDPILETRASSDATYVRRAVLQFDTAPVLSSSARIASAKLVLTVKSGNSETRRLSACAVPVSFREAYVTWRKRDSDSYWRNAGGDVVTSDCSSASVTGTANSKVTFDVTEQVQKAVSGRYGSRYARFLVGDVGGASRASYKQYYSNNVSTSTVRPTLVISTGTTSTSSGSSTPPADQTSTSTTGSTLKVMQWNTHHGGYGTDGRYDPNRLANWIVRINPDIVSLNEIEYYTGWGNENQPARYAAMLKAKTGRTWYYKFYTASGAAKGNGNLILSRFPFRDTDRLLLADSRAVTNVTIVVNGRPISMFSTHLDADSTSRRLTEIGELKTWASGISEQRIIAGDFNAWPGTTENARMTANYYDSWAEAVKKGIDVAYSGNTAGNTRNSRIDYIYYSHGASALVLRKVQVFDVRDSNGVMPSDHRPVLATFTVR